MREGPVGDSIELKTILASISPPNTRPPAGCSNNKPEPAGGWQAQVAELTTGGPFKESQYLFFDTEVFTWEGLPTIESLNDPARNTMDVDWVRGWKLVRDESGTRVPPP
jgi:hypothetical protein